ncbi:PLD nuclease N-terminal domain-containing protein [Clavibacter sp. Sh2141]|uniref:PLD nuclease N-terminal domain-containing protein n=1 Tax=unclassified Clavibacter TaxID=2626594 RepID=UPI0039BD1A31
MPRLLIGLAVVIVFFTVFVIVDTSLTPRTRMRGLPKPAWIAVVVLVPLIGGILWLTIGKDRTDLARSSGRRLGPDDDPDFLSGLGRTRSEEERIRRLEQELADLDSDGPDTPPAPGAPGGSPRPSPDDDDRAPGRRDA